MFKTILGEDPPLNNKSLKPSAMSAVKDQLSDKFLTSSISLFAFATVAMVCLYPESSLAVTFDGSLDVVNTTSSKFQKIVLPGAAGLGSVAAIVKGNLAWAAGLVGVALVSGLTIQWLSGGMKFA
jgi:hypothetical protein